MAGPERKKHIIVSGTSKPLDYTYPQKVGGSSGIKTPPRDRAKHGAELKEQFSAIRNRLPQLQKARAALGTSDESGLYIEFASEPRFDLALKSLDRRGRGKEPKHIELLSSREHEGTTYATVLVPPGKLDALELLVTRYIEEENQYGNPKNRDLVESISQLRIAAIESLWTDDPGLMPPLGVLAWWEAWLRAGESVIEAFEKFATNAGCRLGSNSVSFVDRTVLLVQATREQMSQSAELLDCISELRLAKEIASPILELPAHEQREWVDYLAQRTDLPDSSAPSVCVLDSGVMREHPLLKDVVQASDLHSVHPEWGTTDSSWWRYHGTQMAGLAIYGDLKDALHSNDRIHLEHTLESVKILPPRGYRPNTPDLYGAITEDAVSQPEIENPTRHRVYSLAVTTDDHRDRGEPSSWSAKIDLLAYGDSGEDTRLFVISAGNIDDREQWKDYPNSNDLSQVRDPGQAWNALTVGAYTQKSIVDQAEYPGWVPLAKPGGLSPSSRTSTAWKSTWPTKPDLVMEGGNAATSPNNDAPDCLDDLSLLTTGGDNGNPFVATGDTSAATAQAARLAAILRARYPAYWPETIRGLLVHSAEWTPEMRKSVNGPKGEQKNVLLRRHGYGVPSLERASWSASHQLTLIAQETIKPYKLHPSEPRVATDKLGLHHLPWPTEALANLGNEQVRLRVTLSYFVEPDPARRGFANRFQYASHGLRFRMIRPDEDYKEFLARVTKEEQNEEEGVDLRQSEWVLGHVLRSRGSIHSDWWEGPAVDLASRSTLAVYPVGGWWKERKHMERYTQSVRYSLIVSIHTKKLDVDLYTPVETLISSTIQV